MALLLDGDVFLYRTTFAVEKPVDWGDDLWTLHGYLDEAVHVLQDQVRALEQRFQTDAIFCLSDTKNFRYRLFPDYKANRKSQRKPLLHGELRSWALANLKSLMIPDLEADDVMGIHATKEPGHVIVTIDKDLMGIEGLHFNPDKDEKVRQIEPHTARAFHLAQTIAGDSVDGIRGVPGMGMKRSIALIEKKGPHWSTVVGAYEKAGLSENDALLTARLVKILDFKLWESGELWSPEFEEVVK